MENKNETGKKVGTFFKNLFLKNVGVKIVALFFATVLWGVVLTLQNPSRVKTIQNVPISFAGEADLQARDLVVRGNPLAGMEGIAVRVSTPITNYAELSADYISASVSLNNVKSAGIWELPVNAIVSARLADTQVVSVTPEKITVEVDVLTTKTVPVEAYYEGALPNGYWGAPAELSMSYVNIRGPKQDIEHVTRAICKIQMTDRKQSYNDAVTVTPLDENGNEMDSSLFLGSLPAVTVKMTVYPMKRVPVNVTDSLLGADNLPANYKLYAATATPATLDIVGDAAALEGIDSLMLAGLDVAGRKESIHETLPVQVPDGVTLLGSDGEVEVFVDIREKTSSKRFEAVPIVFSSLAKGLKATISSEATDIDISGRISLVDLLERNDVEAFVDLKGLKEGTYELDVSVYLGDDETTLELTSVLSVSKVSVTIEKA